MATFEKNTNSFYNGTDCPRIFEIWGVGYFFGITPRPKLNQGFVEYNIF